jgi:hypothetical protein
MEDDVFHLQLRCDVYSGRKAAATGAGDVPRRGHVQHQDVGRTYAKQWSHCSRKLAGGGGGKCHSTHLDRSLASDT